MPATMTNVAEKAACSAVRGTQELVESTEDCFGQKEREKEELVGLHCSIWHIDESLNHRYPPLVTAKWERFIVRDGFCESALAEQWMGFPAGLPVLIMKWSEKSRSFYIYLEKMPE